MIAAASPARPSPPRLAPRLRRLHEGFTLIELMIVVAIIGILSAIAIPQYQIYTGKAQLTEAIMIVDSRKTAIAERIQGGFALSTIHGGTSGIPVDLPSGAGAYADAVVVASGVITVTMRSSGIASCVKDAALTLTPIVPSVDAAPITWSCATTAVCKPQNCS